VPRKVLFLAEDALEGGCVARALGHSILTEADSWDGLKTAIRDAVQRRSDEGEDVPGVHGRVVLPPWGRGRLHLDDEWGEPCPVRRLPCQPMPGAPSRSVTGCVC